MQKVVLVTGAGRGLGRDLAEAFAVEGAIVAVNDLTPVNLDVTLANIRGIGGQAKEYLFDVAFQLQCRAMVAEIIADWGRLDILVNAARVMPKAEILEMDEWDWRRTLDVNLSSAFFLTQTAGRIMLEQGGGVIVNIGESVDGRKDVSEKGYSAFFASKVGLNAFTRVAARELAQHQIRVNMITAPKNVLRAEVIRKLLFLCSDSAVHLTGEIIEMAGETPSIT